MGASWQLHSFDPWRWDELFSGDVPDVEKHIVEAIWDGGTSRLPNRNSNRTGYLDTLWRSAPPEMRRLATRTVQEGISYRGLTRKDADLLDRMVVGFFTPEGVAELIDGRVEMQRNGVTAIEVTELLQRSEPARVGGLLGVGSRVSIGQPTDVIHWLRTGRRQGTSEATSPLSRYLILNRLEILQALNDVRGLLVVDRPWKTPSFEVDLRRELLTTLELLADGNRHFAATYSA